MNTILEEFNRRFEEIHRRSVFLIERLPANHLYRKPRELERSMAIFSCGEYILRSAAAVEQTAGGITTRLWDDPFEWTLPEKLADSGTVIDYLNEVENTRRAAFRFFESDEALKKQVQAPGGLRSIFDLLLETLARSEHYQGRAFALAQVVSDITLPRV
jgi:hypothetical protein